MVNAVLKNHFRYGKYSVKASRPQRRFMDFKPYRLYNPNPKLIELSYSASAET